jgi:ribonuclease E
MRPSAPVEEGGSVELKLVEVGLHDPTAGVGKLDGGYDVVVAGAARLVGKKVTATVGRVLEGAAYATLADDVVAAATPITFEAEAEKPTRASRKKETAVADAPGEVVEVELNAEPGPAEVATADVSEGVDEADAETSPDGGTPKKKRTRRGTRGGRNRKKPAATTNPADSETESAAADDNGRPAPRIHVPSADLAVPAPEAQPAEESGDEGSETAPDARPDVDAQPAKKRSRRGSRGGKKRRKPAATGGEDAVPADGNRAVEVVAEDEAPAYVPMSEWIDDFETRSRA